MIMWTAVLIAGFVGACSTWRGRPSSRASRSFHPAEIGTVAIALDAGSQSRVAAGRIMDLLRFILLHQGYRLVPASSAAVAETSRAVGADAVLSVALSFQWQVITQRRGRPPYDHVIDIARISVVATMRRVRDGTVLLNGEFAQGGVDPKTGRPPPRIEDEWETVRRGLAAALAALPARAPVTSLSGPPRHIRHLAVTLAVDEEYQRARGWERRANDRLAGASRILGVEFGIGLVLKEVRRWVSADEPRALGDQLASMNRQVGVDSADIVVGLTGQKSFTPDSSNIIPRGVSEPFGRSVLVRQSGTMTDVPALVDLFESIDIAREVAHLFGALRPDGPQSGELVGFDDRTRQIVALTKNRSFGEGQALNVNADSLMAIYRTAGSQGARLLSIVEQGRVPGH